jgi:predicted RNA-binding protein (TIGR00451 family)
LPDKKKKKPEEGQLITGTKSITSRRIKNSSEFDRSKTKMSLDYIFGSGASKSLDLSKVSFVHSRKTGRIRQVEDPVTGKVLFTFRSNGTIAPSPNGAALLLAGNRSKKRFPWILTVADGVCDFVSAGKTVFCKHVTDCSDSLLAGQDVVVMNEENEVLAVGKSVLAGTAMKEFKRGQAVKVREGVH